MVFKSCQVRMDGFVGTSNPQVAGSIPAEGATRYAAEIRSLFADLLSQHESLGFC